MGHRCGEEGTAFTLSLALSELRGRYDLGQCTREDSKVYGFNHAPMPHRGGKWSSLELGSGDPNCAGISQGHTPPL